MPALRSIAPVLDQGYLEGWHEVLGLSVEEAMGLSRALMRDVVNADPPAWINRGLTRAVDGPNLAVKCGTHSGA